ncbi:ABC transporter substrate-binding protein [Mycobacterium sp. M1]|uniref:ABC transporter substrate-binding protein n=1 Tax=Mycolicibacter acidiphilus TaxID=2835306 RepID=A0ABS5RIU0_9MYCO|nr:ABC transporter substrate-binding protein [Mycolicibacter acidiphilus]MBS9533922.1 ABC transporter substrate-binding protein [Mycolicibacter acidiphilus]
MSAPRPGALRTVAALIAAVTLTATGCAPDRPAIAGPRAGCITDFDPAVDYFPDKSTVLDAVNFRLDYHRSYQVLTVEQPYPGGRPVSYVLVRCGAPAPELTGDLARAQQISTPVTGLFSTSTTHLGMLAELDRTDVVTGVGNPALVVNPAIRDRRTVGFAPGGRLNVEAVLGAAPDVLVTGGLDDPGYPRLRDAGIGVVADAEWLEPSPLGRAEWVKVFAALTGTERRAAQVYDGVRTAYRRLADGAAGTAPADVLPGSMHQGIWSMPTGSGYAGRLIADAGGAYPWAAAAGPEWLKLNFESVYARAGRAPLWLVTDDWRTLPDAVAADPRYAELAALRDGGVWSATRTLGPGGGNDYWERGTARPDLILADLIAILHPDAARDHRFEFYRQVAA